MYVERHTPNIQSLYNIIYTRQFDDMPFLAAGLTAVVSGFSWGSPKILPAGSVCPNLLPIGRQDANIGNEQIYLLSGGRENAAEGQAMAAPGCRQYWGPASKLASGHGCQNFDVVLWAASATALQCGNNCSTGWRKYSISSVHNSLVASDQPRFTKEINDTRFQSSAYTSVRIAAPDVRFDVVPCFDFLICIVPVQYSFTWSQLCQIQNLCLTPSPPVCLSHSLACCVCVRARCCSCTT